MPNRSATTLCWWIVSRLTWRAETKARSSQGREAFDHAPDHLAHAVLDEPGAPVGLFDHVGLVAALHQLVDLRGHRALDDLQQRGGVDLVLAQLGAADVQRAQAALVVRGDGYRLENALDLSVVKSIVLQAFTGAGGDQLLRARARGDSLRGDPDQPSGAELGRHGHAVQGVQLLGVDPGDGRGLVLGEAGLDADLGAARALAGAHELGDVLGQRLGLEGRRRRGRPRRSPR